MHVMGYDDKCLPALHQPPRSFEIMKDPGDVEAGSWLIKNQNIRNQYIEREIAILDTQIEKIKTIKEYAVGNKDFSTFTIIATIFALI